MQRTCNQANHAVPDCGGLPAGNRRRRHYRYAACASGLTVLVSYGVILPMLRGDLQAYLGIGDEQFGLLFSAGPFFGILSALFGGTLLDRIGPVRLIRFALMGLAFSALLFGLAGPHWVGFIVAACVGSLFAGAFTIAVNLYLSRLFPRDRRRILALSLAIGSLGGLLLPLLAEGLLWLAHSRSMSFSQVLHTPFLIVAALLALASFMYKGARPVQTQRQGRTRVGRSIFPPLSLACLGGLLALHGAADSALYLWMAKFLGSRAFADHPLVPGLVLSANALAYLIARLLLTLLPENFGRRAFLVIPGLAGGSLLILGLLSRSYWLTAGGYVCGAFLWSTEYPAMLGAAITKGRQHFGAVMALSGVLCAILTAAFTAATGSLAARLGEERLWIPMLLLACAFPLVGIGGALWLAFFGERSKTVDATPSVLAIRIQGG